MSAEPSVDYLLRVAQKELRWLSPLGFAMSLAERVDGGFHLKYSAPELDLRVRAFPALGSPRDICLLPKDAPDTVPEVLVLIAALMNLEIPRPVAAPQWGFAHQFVYALRALHHLEDHELRGDWSRIDTARRRGISDREWQRALTLRAAKLHARKGLSS